MGEVVAIPTIIDAGNPVLIFQNGYFILMNAWIKYSAKSGVGVRQLRTNFRIEEENSTKPAYRNLPFSTDGTTYSFNDLTASELKKLAFDPYSNKSLSVTYIISYVLNGVEKFVRKTKTISFKSYGMGFDYDPYMLDTNSETIALTGSDKIIVNNASTAEVSFRGNTDSIILQKSRSVTIGSKTVKENGWGAEPINVGKIETTECTISVTDYWGGISTQTFTYPNFVDYVNPTCVLDVQKNIVDDTGKLTFNISGNLYKGSFGAVENKNILHLVYYKVTDSENTDIANADEENIVRLNLSDQMICEDNKYSCEYIAENLDYNSEYVALAWVIDSLARVDAKTQYISFLPMFDWGKDYFNFNVPVTFGKGATNKNKVLWSGGSYMTASQTINLSEPISEQFSGIALIFSRYLNNAVSNTNFHTFFVPKQSVAAWDGKGYTFQMTTVKFATVGAKYLYIYDDSITGNDDNKASGTTNGITFDNSAFVLRAVIGV